LASEQGERWVAVRSFYTGYRTSVRRADELVVRFEFKAPAQGSHQLWRKIGTRNAQAISKAAIALVCEIDEAGIVGRIGFGAGAVAPTVRHLGAAAALVHGKRLGALDLDQLQRAIDADIEPIDDLRSTARYRRHLVRTLIRRFFERLGAG
jgi:xanthine dehydrogenase small subunit